MLINLKVKFVRCPIGKKSFACHTTEYVKMIWKFMQRSITCTVVLGVISGLTDFSLRYDRITVSCINLQNFTFESKLLNFENKQDSKVSGKFLEDYSLLIIM